MTSVTYGETQSFGRGDAGGQYPARFVTVGTLPEAVRRQYGFGWDGRRDLALRMGTEVARRALAVLPPSIRRVA